MSHVYLVSLFLVSFPTAREEGHLACQYFCKADWIVNSLVRFAVGNILVVPLFKRANKMVPQGWRTAQKWATEKGLKDTLRLQGHSSREGGGFLVSGER